MVHCSPSLFRTGTEAHTHLPACSWLALIRSRGEELVAKNPARTAASTEQHLCWLTPEGGHYRAVRTILRREDSGGDGAEEGYLRPT